MSIIKKPVDWRRLNAEFSPKYNRKKIVSSFKEYCHFMFPPGVEIHKFHEDIMDAIQKAIEGDITPRLAIFMPPRHAKTLIGADMFLSYMFGRKLNQCGVYATFGADFAEDRKKAIAGYVRSKRYRWLFPSTRISDDLSEKDLLKIKNKQGMKSTGIHLTNALSPRASLIFVSIGTALTGRPVHYGCCDDLYKDLDEALSEKKNGRAKRWFAAVWNARFEIGTISLLFYTRWVENDVAGDLLAYAATQIDNPDYPQYTVFRYPAYKDKLDDNPFDLRAEGEPLIPGMVGIYETEKQYPDIFDAVYQQNPTGKSDRFVYKDVVLREYDVVQTNFTFLIISVDTTYHAKTKNVDTVGITVLGIKGMDIYLLPDFTNRKLDFNELETTVKEYLIRYPQYHGVIIEGSANGFALENRLSLIANRIMIVDVHASKRVRAQVVHPYFKTGNFWVPSRLLYPRITELYDEMKHFTGMGGLEKDDLLDTLHQSLKYCTDIGLFTNTIEIATVKAKPRNSPMGRRPWQQTKRLRGSSILRR